MVKDNTLIDNKRRRNISVNDYHRVKEVLPSYLINDRRYSKFVNFLNTYYEYEDTNEIYYELVPVKDSDGNSNLINTLAIDEIIPLTKSEYDTKLAAQGSQYIKKVEASPARLIHSILTARDITEVEKYLLDFLQNELLLGSQYFLAFDDKRKSIKFSNNLYKSKGTLYSIQQFFKMFFNELVEVEYPKQNVFIVGHEYDQSLQEQQYADFIRQKVRIKSAYNELIQLNAGLNDDDEIVDTGNLSEWASYLLLDEQNPVDGEPIRRRGEIIQKDYTPYKFTKRALEESLIAFNAWSSNSFISDYSLFINDNLFYAYIPNENISFDYRLKNYIKTAASKIGYESQKFITDDKLYQTLAVLIKTALPMDTWKEIYKLFVHPAGMYLGAKVLVKETADLFQSNIMPDFDPDIAPYSIVETSELITQMEQDITYIINNDANTAKIRVSTYDQLQDFSAITIDQLNDTYPTLEEMIQATSPTMDEDDTVAITFDQDWISLDTFDEVEYDYYPDPNE